MRFTWQSVQDFLRLALTCFGFTVIEPGIAKLLPDWPFPYPQLLGVVASAAVAWLLFAVVNPITFIDVTWTDKARDVTVVGPTLDVERAPQQSGRTFVVSVERRTSTPLGRVLFAQMVQRGIVLQMQRNQSQLQLDVVSVDDVHQGMDGTIRVSLGAPEFPSHRVGFEVGVHWGASPLSDLEASLRHSVPMRGKLGRPLAFVVVRKRQVKRIRMVNPGG